MLSETLGVSRTPVREAMTLLEQEGFLRMVPRRGIYIVRKSKREIVEMIHMWAALESMAARLATIHATDAEIAKLRHMFDDFRDSTPARQKDSTTSRTCGQRSGMADSIGAMRASTCASASA